MGYGAPGNRTPLPFINNTRQLNTFRKKINYWRRSGVIYLLASSNLNVSLKSPGPGPKLEYIMINKIIIPIVQ